MYPTFLVREIEAAEVGEVLGLIAEVFPDAEVQIGDMDRLLVVEAFGRMVGFAHISEEGRKLVLHGFGVSETCRNFGAGTALMEKVAELCDGTDKPMYLKVRGLNPAVHLYERYGFYAKRFGDVHLLVKRAHS